MNIFSRYSRKFIVLSLVAAIMLVSVAFVGSASAGSTYCIAWAVRVTNLSGTAMTVTSELFSFDADVTLAGFESFTLQPGEARDARVLGFAPRSGWFAITFVSVIPVSFELLTSGPVSLDNCLGGKIGDGRINDGGDQLAAPVAVYDTDQGFDVYLINPSNGHGDKIFTATDEEVASVGDLPAANTVIDSANGVALYRLISGEFQINATNFDGSPYAFDWK